MRFHHDDIRSIERQNRYGREDAIKFSKCAISLSEEVNGMTLPKPQDKQEQPNIEEYGHERD